MGTVFVDTGALVALLDRSDEWHKWAVGVFKSLRPPLFTCEAVFAEAWHLLGESGPSRGALAKLHKTWETASGENAHIEAFNTFVSRVIHKACGVANLDFLFLKLRQESLQGW